MSLMPTLCPSCHEKLQVSQLMCNCCGAKLEGSFDLHPILQLSTKDMNFALNFIKVSGNLKQMAKIQNQSYPTIRNQLNDLIKKLQSAEISAEKIRHKILDAIQNGVIDAKEGARRLKESS